MVAGGADDRASWPARPSWPWSPGCSEDIHPLPSSVVQRRYVVVPRTSHGARSRRVSNNHCPQRCPQLWIRGPAGSQPARPRGEAHQPRGAGSPSGSAARPTDSGSPHALVRGSAEPGSRRWWDGDEHYPRTPTSARSYPQRRATSAGRAPPVVPERSTPSASGSRAAGRDRCARSGEKRTMRRVHRCRRGSSSGGSSPRVDTGVHRTAALRQGPHRTATLSRGGRSRTEAGRGDSPVPAACCPRSARARTLPGPYYLITPLHRWRFPSARAHVRVDLACVWFVPCRVPPHHLMGGQPP